MVPGSSPTISLVTEDPQARGAGRRHGRRGRGSRGRRIGVRIALAAGLAGLAVAAFGLAVQLLPRQFTAGQQQQIEAWQVSSRWQRLTAGQIFPATVSYVLPATVLQDAAPLALRALRVGIAPQQPDCTGGVTNAAAVAVLRRAGCRAVLRATYVDATRSYAMTVGVAVLPTAAAAARAQAELAAPRLAATGDADGAARLPAGVSVVRFAGPAAELYDYSRQMAASFTDGPYVVMYAAGYADGRPRVPVSQDVYADDEMTSLARGVAQSVAGTLGAVPAPPHCPGSPGC
jgi:hypothetical protein